MKRLLIMCFCVLGLSVMASAQSPSTPAPPASPASVTSPSVSPNGSPQSDLEKSIRNKHKHHFNFVVGKADVDDTKGVRDRDEDDDIPAMVLPIVVVTMFSIFGAPVLIVGLIMYFGFSRNRAMHRTIRMLAEKGQPIPAALLAPPPPALRQRSDMRRGVVLCMVGLGIMIFFAAVNDWEGGAWAIGVIPFVIGLGYLLVWKLEGDKKNEIPPPPPTS